MPREFLFVTKEAVPGVFDDEADAADKFVVRIDRANGFNALDQPNQWSIRSVEASNRRVQTGNETVTSSGSLSTLMYPSQASLLALWAGTIAGEPPEPPFTLTFDHARMMENPPTNTMVIERYVGAKCQTFRMAANNQGDGVLTRSDFTFLHMGRSLITSTDRPTPSLSTYPIIKPYVFQNLKGGIILRTSGSAVRTHFSSAEIMITNTIFPFTDEDRYPSYLSWRGRDVSATIRFRLESLGDREAMMAATANTMELKFQAGTTPNQYSLNFDFHDEVRITSVEEDRPLDGGFYNAVAASGMLDLTDGTDLTITAAGPV